MYFPEHISFSETLHASLRMASQREKKTKWRIGCFSSSVDSFQYPPKYWYAYPLYVLQNIKSTASKCEH